MIHLIYHNNSDWEIDYVIHELCKDIELTCHFLNTQELIDFDVTLVNGASILAFTSNQIGFDDILTVAKRLNPDIIIHLSDERGNRKHFMELANHTKVLFNQYHYDYYDTDNYSNIIQIPLGYMDKMFHGQYALDYPKKPLDERNYIWSFVGHIHNEDRKVMKEKYECVFGEQGTFFCGSNKTSLEMFDIYNNSIFVPNGRGGSSLNCFRLFEAIFCGAIPICVGSVEETDITFSFAGNKPPFLYQSSWDEAVETCKTLLLPENRDQLEKLRSDGYTWLKKEIESVQQKIRDVLLCE